MPTREHLNRNSFTSQFCGGHSGGLYKPDVKVFLARPCTVTDVEECLEHVIPAARVAEVAAWFAPFTVEDLMAMDDAVILQLLLLRGDGLTFPRRFLFRYLQAAREYHRTHPTLVSLSHVSLISMSPVSADMNAHFLRDCASCGLPYPVHARYLPGATRVGIEEGVVVLAWWTTTIPGFDSQYTGELRHHHCGGC